MDKITACYEWLGIPREKFPPNHYVLLGIPEFEKSKTVIENAAARNIFFLQRFFSSPFAELAQEIQKDVAEAKKHLSDQDLKSAYDVELATRIHEVETNPALESIGRIDVSNGSVSSSALSKTTDTETIRDIIQEGIRSSTMLSEMKHWLIGWDAEKCDIVVNNKFVSAKHCILFCEESRFEIEDLNSTNGTFVNGDRIKPRTRIPVTPKDDITLGRKTMMPWPPIRKT